VQDAAGTIQKKTLLVIDDDVEWTDLLRIYFSQKYNVCVSNHADEAIEAIRSVLPGVIILDLIMPSVDGFGLMHRMNEVSLGEVPTILTTGWGNPDVEQCATAVGCAAVLMKPVSLVELDATVSSLMSGGGVPRKAISIEPPEGQANV
jgi:DNA-binding NtrC family response regulator